MSSPSPVPHLPVLTLLIICLLTCIPRVSAHARLMEPPSRASMWRLGYDNPPDFNDHQGFCGGFKHQYGRNGGRCGICGDPADAWPRHHEAPGGRFANGIITRQYRPGQDIVVKIDVTANHKGFFVFKLCSNNNTVQDPVQSCFDDTVLRIVPSGEDRYYLTTFNTGVFTLKLRLPPNVRCSQCILQWTYTAGNNWGSCQDQGVEGASLGCGPQETFRACSDIAIAGSSVKPNRFQLNPNKLEHNSLPYPGTDPPPLRLPPMFEEVPLPSIPLPPKSDSDASSPDFHLNYFSLVESYIPEYFDDLPSEIMNHFRTSSPVPVYDTGPEVTTALAPAAVSHSPVLTCVQDSLLSPCNPHLPSFSLTDLSQLASLELPPADLGPREPSQLLPPSGRVPYPMYRPEYGGMRGAVTPLPAKPRQYVHSSTIRPHAIEEARHRVNNRTRHLNMQLQEMEKSSGMIFPPFRDDKITTYRPKFSLKQTTEKSITDDEGIARIKSRLSEIINKLREKERSGESADLSNLHQWYTQRRKNGQRFYPDNQINPHLPVTHGSTSTSTTQAPSEPPDNYFTVTNRKINGEPGQTAPSVLLLCAVIMHTIMSTV